jgi:hypothetical protein
VGLVDLDVLEVVHLVVGEYVPDGVVLGGRRVGIRGCFLGEGLFPAYASAPVGGGLDALAVDLGGLRRGVRGELLVVLFAVVFLFVVVVVVVVVFFVAARIFGYALEMAGVVPRLVLLSRAVLAALVRELREEEREMLAEGLFVQLIVAVAVSRAHQSFRDRLLREHALREGELAPGEKGGDDAEDLRVRVPR